MGYGLTRQGRIVVAFGQFALVKPLRAGVKAESKLRCLHIRPSQIGVAIFDIARPFALAVADFRTVHTAAIGSLVPHRGKAADRTGFQRDRLRQDRADALHGEQLLVSWRVIQTLMHGLFERFDLLPQTV